MADRPLRVASNQQDDRSPPDHNVAVSIEFQTEDLYLEIAGLRRRSRSTCSE